MGLIGLIIASLVNLYFQNSMFDLVLAAIGVLVFTGLTAWDTQQIKEMYFEADDVAVMGRKAIMGALRLYLDFINLFLSLLRIFGSRE
jgi:FtsH-binding integral membrane protein